MSCLNALHAQIVTFLSVPHEILLLQHKVFREYAKIAVGPDFIHTLPSFFVVTAMVLVFWKCPPTSKRLSEAVCSARAYKLVQVTVSWVSINAVLWLWLIFQRVLYCSIWTYWSYESEYREISYPWWQRVWSSYYPPPLRPPVFSSGFISWIISMALAVAALGCAISTNRVRAFVEDSTGALQNALVALKWYTLWSSERVREILTSCERGTSIDDSEISSVGDECRSEASGDASNAPRPEVHPISYGTNWTPRPSFAGYKDSQRKPSAKSLHVPDDSRDGGEYSPRQLRLRRGCHTVIPSNSSDKSSGC